MTLEIFDNYNFLRSEKNDDDLKQNIYFLWHL